MFWKKIIMFNIFCHHMLLLFLSWKLEDMEKSISLLQVADKLYYRSLVQVPSLWAGIRLKTLVHSKFIINISEIWIKLNWNNLNCNNDKLFWYLKCSPLKIINYDQLKYRKSCPFTYTFHISSLPITKWDFIAFVRINLVPSATQGYVSWKLW